MTFDRNFHDLGCFKVLVCFDKTVTGMVVKQVQLRMEYTARAEMPPLAGDFLADLATLARQLRCAMSFSRHSPAQPCDSLPKLIIECTIHAQCGHHLV